MDSLYVQGPKRWPPEPSEPPDHPDGKRPRGTDAEATYGRASGRGALARAVRELADDARAWCQGRSALVRVPVVIYLAYVLVGHWGDLEYSSLMGGINFGIHEIGHVVFIPFGEFLMVAGGTILQCAAPCVAAWLFLRQRDYFAVAFCLGWLGTNLFHCATYCADARGKLNLVLYTPGGYAFGSDGVGDWSRMLGALDILSWDQTIAATLRLAASAAMLAGIGVAAWLLWQMRSDPDHERWGG